MGTRALTTANFSEVIGNGIVLVDWWASWCGPCRLFAPIYETASGRHPDVTFGKVDTDAESDLAAAFGIRAIPTLMVFRDGILLLNQAGVVRGPALDDLIARARAIDMDDVRERIAEVEAEQRTGSKPGVALHGAGA